MAGRRKKVYTGSKVPPPKQTNFGKQLREYRKQLKKLGRRK